MSRVKVYQHRGLAITLDTSQPRNGYSIDHPDFQDQTFPLIQNAIDAIDERSIYQVGIRWESHRINIYAKSSTEAKRIFCKRRGIDPNDPWSGISIVTAKKVKGAQTSGDHA